ncbi:MAG: hypothetical protein DMF51_14575 [Acidobacteria bacterium]|nr:MAG: hypothetical protein DMF51_14575 [Acidobacteriota bacterium]
MLQGLLVATGRRSCVGVAFLLLAALPAAAQTVNDPGLQVEVVAGGLSQPTTMAFIGDGDILVLQKANGQVRRIIGGVLQPAPVLDVGVGSLSERGLLGIALDPDFPVNRHVYLYLTESSTGADTVGVPGPVGNRVYRGTWDGTTLVNPTLILDLPVTPGPNHNGGVLAFGPDGALYAVIGDQNRGGKLQNLPNGAAPDNTGVIFRVDTSGAGLPDNPFFNPLLPTDPMNRYYAYGVRNSFGLTFDPWDRTRATRRVRAICGWLQGRSTAIRNSPGRFRSPRPRWSSRRALWWAAASCTTCWWATTTAARCTASCRTPRATP